MSSIVYNGHDLSPYVTAELVEPAGHALSPRSLAVPGRPGAALLGCELPPRVLRVRLFLDAGVTLIDTGAAGARELACLLREAGIACDARRIGALELHASGDAEEFECLAEVFLGAPQRGC